MTPKATNVYDDILKMYVGKQESSELRNWLCVPFFIGDIAVATNAHEMVFFPKKLIKEATNI